MNTVGNAPKDATARGGVESLESTTYTKTETDSLLSGKASSSHTHDDRYYTETEINNLLSDKILVYEKTQALNANKDETIVTFSKAATTPSNYVWLASISNEVGTDFVSYISISGIYYASKNVYVAISQRDRDTRSDATIKVSLVGIKKS